MSSFSPGRRRFTIGAMIAAVSAVVMPKRAIGQAAATSIQPAISALDQQAQAAMAKLSPQARAEVEMKVAEVFRKHGSQLSDEQKADVRKVMAETQEGLEKMRVFALDNGDQPATVFHPYRSEDNR
jgi:acyl-CoA reductase-like NAD-dependent aldehyde dehydrogenase